MYIRIYSTTVAPIYGAKIQPSYLCLLHVGRAGIPRDVLLPRRPHRRGEPGCSTATQASQKTPREKRQSGGRDGSGWKGGGEESVLYHGAESSNNVLLILCGRSKYHSLQTRTRLEPILGVLARIFTDSNHFRPFIFLPDSRHTFLAFLLYFSSLERQPRKLPLCDILESNTTIIYTVP